MRMRIEELEVESESHWRNVTSYLSVISIMLKKLGGEFTITSDDIKNTKYWHHVTQDEMSGPLIFKSCLREGLK